MAASLRRSFPFLTIYGQVTLLGRKPGGGRSCLNSSLVEIRRRETFGPCHALVKASLGV